LVFVGLRAAGYSFRLSSRGTGARPAFAFPILSTLIPSPAERISPELLGIDIVVRWSNDPGASDGIDPETPLTFEMNNAQTLVVLESMKMEVPLACEADAEVLELMCSLGEVVEEGAVLLTWQPAAQARGATSPVPAHEPREQASVLRADLARLQARRALLADTTEALRPSWGRRQYAWIWAAMATKMVVQHVRDLFDEVCRMAAMTRSQRTRLPFAAAPTPPGRSKRPRMRPLRRNPS
jgi:hypothetical protein